MPKPRIVFFDIESTNLKANFGYCLCFGWKQLGGKTRVLSVTQYRQHASDPTNDAPLMRDVHRILTDEADIIVSYYGKEFDRKFLNTRMLLAGLPPLPPLSHEHVDLYYTARGNLALHSNRLAVVAETLGCPVAKTPLSGPIWTRAMAGHKPAIKYIINHCARDVDVLEWCYLKLRPFVRQHPWVVLKGSGCRVCGSAKGQRRGFSAANGVIQQRVRCMDCGAWRVHKIEA